MLCDVVCSAYQTNFKLVSSRIPYPLSAHKRVYWAGYSLLISSKVVPTYSLELQSSKSTVSETIYGTFCQILNVVHFLAILYLFEYIHTTENNEA